MWPMYPQWNEKKKPATGVPAINRNATLSMMWNFWLNDDGFFALNWYLFTLKRLQGAWWKMTCKCNIAHVAVWFEKRNCLNKRDIDL